MKNYLLCTIALLLSISFGWSQAPYFSRIYANFPEWEITEAHFHPDGGFTTIFKRGNFMPDYEIHRMDGAGNITASFPIPTVNSGCWTRIIDTGEHWVTWGIDSDSISVALLDSNLNPIWINQYQLDLPPNRTGRATGLDLVAGGAVVMGRQDEGATQSVGYFFLKLDVYGQEVWGKSANGLWGLRTVPYHMLELANGNLAATGIEFNYGSPNHNCYLHLMDSIGDSLKAWRDGYALSVGQPHEHPAGELSFLSAFGYWDSWSSVFYTDKYRLDGQGNVLNKVRVSDSLIATQYFPVGGGNEFTSLMENNFKGMFLHNSLTGDSPVVLSGFGPMAIIPDLGNNSRHMDQHANGDLLIGTHIDAATALPLLLFMGSAGIVQTELQEAQKNAQLTVFPNPSSGKFWIEVSGKEVVKGEWVLRNAVGQIVHRQNENGGPEIDVGHLPKGFYLLSLLEKGHVLGRKRITIQ